MTDLYKPLMRKITVSAGQSQSTATNYLGYVPVALWMPAAWTVAPISFRVGVQPGSTNDADILPLYDETGEYVIASAQAGVLISLNHCLFLGMSWLAVRSGTAVAPVAQTSKRELKIVLRIVT
jgi:hypothetical protein